MSDPDSEALLARVAAGDRAACDEILARHRAFLLQVVQVRMDDRVRGRVDPSDVVQEAQLDVFRRLPEFLERRPMPFRLWLRQTAFERLLKVHRRHLGAEQRDAARERALPEGSSCLLAGQLLAGGPSPSELVDRRELTRRVRVALATLGEADQEVLLLRCFEGLSNQEAADVLGLDPAAASKRHARALLRLRQALIDSGLKESPA